MYLHIWSIVVIRNWHWCQVRVHTHTYLRTVREFMYVDLNRNHQSTHKFDYNFFWMGVTNWNFYHLAENVFTAFVLEQREQKECRQIREGGGHCSTVNSGATRTPSVFTPIYCSYPDSSCTIPGVSMQRVWQNSWELFTCSNGTSTPAPLPRTRIQLFLQWPSLTVNMLHTPLPRLSLPLLLGHARWLWLAF